MPDGRNTFQMGKNVPTFTFPRPSKMFQNFWFENKASGNPNPNPNSDANYFPLHL
jgi:hypothetical protein